MEFELDDMHTEYSNTNKPLKLFPWPCEAEHGSQTGWYLQKGPHTEDIPEGHPLNEEVSGLWAIESLEKL